MNVNRLLSHPEEEEVCYSNSRRYHLGYHERNNDGVVERDDDVEETISRW